jgi:glutamyl-tRNA reductase
VEEKVAALPNITLVNVDDLATLKDATLKKRKAEVPKAKAIIAEVMQEFLEWNDMRKHLHLLKNLKIKLKELQAYSGENDMASAEMLDIKIQRVINETAGKIRKVDTKGCQFITAINDFICTA